MWTGVATVGRCAGRVLVSAVCFGCAIAIAALVRWGVINGPLSEGQPLPELTVIAAVALAAGGSGCIWVLARVATPWHADGPAAGAVLVCMAAALVVGWEGAPPGVRSAAEVVAPLVGPALLEPLCRRASVSRGVALAAGLVVAAASFAVFALRDPFHDPDCWFDCALKDVAPWPAPGATTAAVTALVAAELGAAVLAWYLWARLAQHRPRGIAGWLDVAVATSAALAVTSFASTGLVPTGRPATVALGLGVLALVGLGVLLVAQPIPTLVRRRRLRDLAFALGDAPLPGTLENALAKALGDPGVRVAYWLPESGSFVDAVGRPTAAATAWPVTLTRDGEPVAAVQPGDTERGRTEVQDLIGSTARLAIDSERVQAGIRAQLNELQASRRRVVASADDTRRTVERTIHDIVQAELLGALYEVARIRSGPPQAGVDRDEATAIGSEIGTLIANIREVSRGIYPAALESAGLTIALETLADDAPAVLTVDSALGDRLPPEVERATYLLVHDLVMQSAGEVTVRLDRVADDLAVHVDGVAGPVPAHLADRIGALGGRCRLLGSTLEAVLPCG